MTKIKARATTDGWMKQHILGNSSAQGAKESPSLLSHGSFCWGMSHGCTLETCVCCLSSSRNPCKRKKEGSAGLNGEKDCEKHNSQPSKMDDRE